jgi:hypothetical protein
VDVVTSDAAVESAAAWVDTAASLLSRPVAVKELRYRSLATARDESATRAEKPTPAKDLSAVNGGWGSQRFQHFC